MTRWDISRQYRKYCASGFTSQGLPIGCQLLGRAFDEPTLFTVAAALEAALDVGKHAPKLAVDA